MLSKIFHCSMILLCIFVVWVSKDNPVLFFIYSIVIVGHSFMLGSEHNHEMWLKHFKK